MNSIATRGLLQVWFAIASLSAAGAQEVRGTVTDSASGAPVAGVVLVLLDSSGTALNRNITNERGQYRLATKPAATHINVVRLGFRPRVILLPRVTPAILQLDVTMARIPTLLETVQVTANGKCPGGGDRIALSLLEQARGGLLATVVAREANPATMVRLLFTRRYDGTGDRIERQEVQIASEDGLTRSYRAGRTGAEFVRLGFSRDSAGVQIFYGPDADVLLDDDFVAGYCFRIRDQPRDRQNQVGLAFRPARSSRGRVDIDGTLWIDTVSRELRDIEFAYVGLDHELDVVHPGGRVAFRSMANGMVLIDRWGFRLAGVHDDTIVRIRSESVRRSYFATESGGEVASARWVDGRSWQSSLGNVRGRAVDRNDSPVGRLTVGLAGTNYRAITDSVGGFHIPNVLPGPYTVTILDSVLAPLGIMFETPLTLSAQRDTTLELRLHVPATTEFVGSRCAAGRRRTGAGGVQSPIMGRVLTPDGQSVVGARLTLSVEDYDGRWIVISTGAETGSDGVFAYCEDLPRRGMMELQVRRGRDAVSVTRFQLARSGDVTVVPVRLKN